MASACTDKAMKKLKVLGRVLRHTGADKIIAGFIGFLLLCSVVIWICEPDIHTWREALWYCFTVVSTIGFGDVVVHTAISRGLTVVLSLYAVVTLAIFTGVIVNYFTQLVELRQRESLAAIMEKLERLPELSRQELEQLSDQIRKRL